jgi:hypothetical protein
VGAGDLPQMEGGQSVKLTVHLHQVSRFRMNGAASSLHLTHLWFTQGQLYLTMIIVCVFRGCHVRNIAEHVGIYNRTLLVLTMNFSTIILNLEYILSAEKLQTLQ